MAAFTIPRLTYLRPSLALVPYVAPKVAPVTTTILTQPVLKVAPLAPVVVKPPAVPVSPYLPSVAPRVEPVIYQTMPAPVSPAPVVAPEPAPLVPHRFSTCATCGEEKVTDIDPTPAPTLSAPAPTPAAPAPTPAPATPTATPKAKASGWLIAFAIVLLLSGGLALASAVRPRK